MGFFSFVSKPFKEINRFFNKSSVGRTALGIATGGASEALAQPTVQTHRALTKEGGTQQSTSSPSTGTTASAGGSTGSNSIPYLKHIPHAKDIRSIYR